MKDLYLSVNTIIRLSNEARREGEEASETENRPWCYGTVPVDDHWVYSHSALGHDFVNALEGYHLCFHDRVCDGIKVNCKNTQTTTTNISNSPCTLPSFDVTFKNKIKNIYIL